MTPREELRAWALAVVAPGVEAPGWADNYESIVVRVAELRAVLYLSRTATGAVTSRHYPGERRAKCVWCASVEELRGRVEELRQALVSRAAERARRAKLRGLRERSLEAQVEALATAHGWQWCVRRRGAGSRLASVLVRLDQHHTLVVDVPHADPARAGELLVALVERGREVHALGGSLRISQAYAHTRVKWRGGAS